MTQIIGNFPLVHASYLILPVMCSLFLTGCGWLIEEGPPPDEQEQKQVQQAPLDIYRLTIETEQELDSLYGKYIELSGKLENIDGRHAFIELGSGLRIYLTHADKMISDKDWFNMLGKQVSVVGKLVASCDYPIDGKTRGPFISHLRSIYPLE